jgi:hypothetical protein
MVIAVIVGMHAAIGVAETKPVLGNDGGTSRQSVFPDNAQNSRFGATNQVQHGTSTWSDLSTRGVVTNVPSSTVKLPSGVLTNPPGSSVNLPNPPSSTVNLPNPPSSTVNLPSGVITNPPGSTTDQPSDTNGPNNHLITP